ncbi:MAG: hypothetical protein M0P39_02635 [Rhodocyclaceae bacterium]|nr:hypothetical protein [Rhodocyclaceae bacterium]
MNTRNQLWCVWSGVIFLVLFGLGWGLIARFVPPPAPALGAGEIADFYRQNTQMIRLGLVVTQISCIFLPPWVAALSVQMKRVEGSAPVLAYTQLICGLAAMLVILGSTLIWGTVAFRPERDPELLQLINDLGWLIFTMTFAPFSTQGIAVALAIFSDKGAEPMFPRWVAYFNLWTATIFLPTGLILFFKTGPFAWNGLIGFWLPVGEFGLWFAVMTVLMLKAIKRQAG